MKPLEGSIGKTSSDINCTSVFLGQSPKEVEIKTYLNKWDIIKLTRFFKAKKTIKKTRRRRLTIEQEKYLQMMKQAKA